MSRWLIAVLSGRFTSLCYWRLSRPDLNRSSTSYRGSIPDWWFGIAIVTVLNGRNCQICRAKRTCRTFLICSFVITWGLEACHSWRCLLNNIDYTKLWARYYCCSWRNSSQRPETKNNDIPGSFGIIVAADGSTRTTSFPCVSEWQRNWRDRWKEWDHFCRRKLCLNPYWHL